MLLNEELYKFYQLFSVLEQLIVDLNWLGLCVRFYLILEICLDVLDSRLLICYYLVDLRHELGVLL